MTPCKKGQILLRVQSPEFRERFLITGKRWRTKRWPKNSLNERKLLYDKGAISLNDFQVAEDTEAKAKVDVETTLEHSAGAGSGQGSSRSRGEYRRTNHRA